MYKLKKPITALALVFLTLMLASMVVGGLQTGGASAETSSNARIWTDKADYRPGELVIIYGIGFLPNSNIEINVVKEADGTITTLTTTSQLNGNFTATYQLDESGAPLYTVTATDGTNNVSTTFTDTSPARRQYVRGTVSGSTSLTATLTQAPLSGNVLIAVIGTYRNGSTTVRTVDSINGGSGGTSTWTKAISQSRTWTQYPVSYAINIEIWYGVVSSPSTTVTATLSGSSSTDAVIQLMEYSGIATTTPLDKTSTASNTGTSTSTGTTTTTAQASELWIGGVTVGANYAQTTPQNNFELINGATFASTMSVSALQRIVTSTGAASTGTTISSSSNYVGAIATFKSQISVTVTSSPDTGDGFVTVNGTARTSPFTFNANPGSTQTIGAVSIANEVTGQSRYLYSSWSDSGAQSHTITVGSSDVTYTANFQRQYYLTVTGGSSTTGQGWYNEGAGTTATSNGVYGVSGDTRSRVASWQLDAQPVNPVNTEGTVTTSTITMSAPHTVAFASVTQYMVTYASAPVIGGTTDPSGTNVWVDSGSHPISATPNPTYTFKTWSSDTGQITFETATSASTTANINGPGTITANFMLNEYTITPSAGIGGSISPNTPQTVIYGEDSPLFTITPDAGYHIFDVLVDGVSQGAITTYTFTNVIADHTIHAVFAQNPVTHFVVSGYPDSTTAGEAHDFTVTAKDEFGNTITGYTGTVHFTSSDGQATLPADYTFTSEDAGVHTFSATLKTAGTQSITATDRDNSDITGSQVGIEVLFSTLHHFVFSNIDTQTAGDTFLVTITAVDSYGNTVTTYEGQPQLNLISGSVWPSTVQFESGTWTGGLTITLAGQNTITATDGDTTGTSNTFTVNPNTLTTIKITGPSSVTAGFTATYTAEGFDTFGNSLGDVTNQVTWSIEAEAAGQWNQNVYTAEKAGTWQVTGKIDETISDTAELTVEVSNLHHITVLPTAATTEAGIPQSYTVQAFDEFNNLIGTVTDETEFSCPGATVTGNQVSATTAGSYTVTATYGGKTDSTSLTVTATALSYITITPTQATITAGQTQTYTILAYDQYGNLRGDVSTDASFAITPAAGGSWTANEYTAAIEGTWTVTASYQTATDVTAELTVNRAELNYIALTPNSQTIKAGETQTFTVTAYDAYGNNWDITPDALYNIQENAGGSWTANEYTSEKAGVWTVTASFEGKTGTAQLTVLHANAVSIAVSPGTASITAGGSVGYSATATDAYGNTWDVTGEVEWGISVGAGGSWDVEVAGTYVSEKAGSWTVTATLDGLSDSAALTVSHAAVDHIVVDPEASTIVAGGSETYTVTAYDVFGNTWGVTGDAVLSIEADAEGSVVGNVVSATKVGTWTVTVSFAGAEDVVARLSVLHAAAMRVDVAPSYASVTAGDSQVFAATATDAYGNTWDVTGEVEWSIVEAGAGGSWVQSTGTYTSEFAGSWTVTATFGALSDTASLAVGYVNAPTTTIQLSGTAGLNGWYTSSVTVTLTAIDQGGLGSGISAIYYTINDGPIQIITASSGFFNINADGTYVVSYWAVDKWDNVETAKTATIKIDTTNPSTTATPSGTLLTGETNWYTGTVTVTLSPIDATSGVDTTYYSLDGVNFQEYTGQISITTEGTTTIYYFSTDNAGNTETTKTLTVNVAYTVTFTATGLPAGTSWSVTVGDETKSSTEATITFQLKADSYQWSVSTPISGAAGIQYVTSPTQETINVPATTSMNIPYTTQYQVTYIISGAENAFDPPETEWINENGVATGVFPDTVTVGGVQDNFTSDNRPGAITGPTTITGTYQTSYWVTYQVTGNENAITAPTSQWVNKNSAATGSFTPSVTVGGVKDDFVGDNRPSAITGPTTVTGTYQTSYWVTYAVVGNQNPITPPASEWVAKNSAASGGFTAVVTVGGVRDTFVGDNRPSAITAPTTITGTYQTSYLVTYVVSGAQN
ncbi:MAG: hypothetical protein NWE98_09640, partial [Candidatus Bathyarchaeota archaeon]|nr:hypothetical protein [Candidatus Bathyarchaeota archaeon]